MTNTSSNTVSAHKRRSALVWLVLPLSLFPLAALLTYDARVYTEFPPPPTANWIGALGDGFAHAGYVLFGFAIWIVPILCVIAALAYVFGRSLKILRRLPWLCALLTAAACLAQVLAVHGGPFAALASRINIPDAGGAVGYLLMTRCLAPLLSDFGSSILMILLLIVSAVLLVGLETFGAILTRLGAWVRGGSLFPPADPEQARVEEEARAEAKRLAEEARAAAKRQKEEERERIRAEKLREQEEKRAAREAEEARRQAEREARRNAPAPEPPPEPEPETEPVAKVPPAQKASRPAVKPKQAAGAETPPEKPDKGPYQLPPLSLLNPLKKSVADHGDVGETTKKLVDTLKLFGVDATLAYTVEGPVVTKYALDLAPGTRYSAVTGLSDNLMGALHAKSLRIEAPIPGEECVGIEVPNAKPAGISFREIFESEAWRNFTGELPLLFGKNAAGKELIADLASMPHMLVAGATGQGKSVCLNAIINGLLMTKTPEQLKLIMVDPKSVEFTSYAAIPHLIVPIITENKKVAFSLRWAVQEMEKRLKLFARARVRNIYDFNHRPNVTQTDMFGDDQPVGSDMPKSVPYIVIIIDEVADLMAACAKEVTPDIARLTAKARAAGIHLILATQRPDAKVITGTIKANIPGRVAFKTSQAIDSRTILDEAGAENLIGRGDMLFKGKDGVLVRAQGAWISDPEIASITKFIEEHANTAFDDRFTKKLSTIKEEEVDLFADEEADDAAAKEEAAAQREQVKADENASDFKKAIECIINTNRASTSHFQRKLGWGYNHSAKIMDMLEDAGVIGPQVGAGPRSIIMEQEQLLAIFNGSAAEAANTVPVPAAEENATAEFPETTPNEEEQT